MLSQEEKVAVANYLATKQGGIKFWVYFIPYLAPPLAFFGYGAWQRDAIALCISFAVLFSLIVWYLSITKSTAVLLQSALRAYESKVGALSNQSSDEA